MTILLGDVYVALFSHASCTMRKKHHLRFIQWISIFSRLKHSRKEWKIFCEWIHKQLEQIMNINKTKKKQFNSQVATNTKCILIDLIKVRIHYWHCRFHGFFSIIGKSNINCHYRILYIFIEMLLISAICESLLCSTIWKFAKTLNCNEN